jgi:hypothetical protein
MCEFQRGVFLAGGSISNLYAFLAARHRMFPDYKQKGLSCIPGQLVMYTSDQVGHEAHTDPRISTLEIWAAGGSVVVNALCDNRKVMGSRPYDAN